MITKFLNIKNLAVFKNFDWNNEVRDKGNNVILFNKINILYGRNYSGKTTLSRIARALETGRISDKYENPQCTVCITDNADVVETDFHSHNKTIRVFNDDFIKENLRFIVNQDENVQSFAILGEGNNEIEEEIERLKSSLGSNEEKKETGLYKDFKSFNALYVAANKTHSDANSSLKNQLNSKATGQPNGIKYQPEKYGEVNYDIRKLKNDIISVKKTTFIPLTDAEKLEIFLFYKYPDSSKDIDKLKKFFGDEDIPALLTDRINNEYSHLAGIFERGQQPVEVPEMKKAAQLIINRIKELDEDQYDALLTSVGFEVQEREVN